VLFLLFRFGIDLLVSFSAFISGSGGSQGTISNNQINFIPPPILNPLSPATNSAQITISGKAIKDQTIFLYVNDIGVDQTDVNKDGVFIFEQALKNGDNQIKVRAEYKGKKSDFSDSFSVVFKNSPPTLDVSSPTDGQSFKKDQNTTYVSGKTDSGVTVTVNGFWAVVDDNNNFSYTLSLQNGDNQIKIVALDQAGNRAEKNLKINYSQ
jgi:bacillopeptidase F